MITHPKVVESHLKRQAVIYIRQSSPLQVQQHQESQKRQYQLVERAQLLGWPAARCVVIDEDLGLSGAHSANRPGYQRLSSMLALREVGIILGLEVSRLARNSLDWKPFSRNTLKNGFNSNPPDPSGPSSARAIIAGAGIREGGEGNPH